MENAEHLDIVMPMHNLIEYSKNYRKTTGSLWHYYKVEPNNPLFVLDYNNRPTNTFNYNADPILNYVLFKYKNSFIGKNQTMIMTIIIIM